MTGRRQSFKTSPSPAETLLRREEQRLLDEADALERLARASTRDFARRYLSDARITRGRAAELAAAAELLSAVTPASTAPTLNIHYDTKKVGTRS